MIEKIAFGNTGHISSRTLFGAAALGKVSQEEANITMELLLEHGVNHIDTAASYGQGMSERNLAQSLAKYRDRFFLATKTGKRTYDEAWSDFRGSLERMQVSGVDMIQLHNLVSPEEWETAMAPGGALEAAQEMRDQGLTRYIGITGHGLIAPRSHLKSLEQFDFDAVLLPWNYTLWQNEQYRADFMALKEEVSRRGIALQTIKSIARRPWGDQDKNRTTWYQPLEEQEDIDRAVSWLLSFEGIFLNTVGDIHVLPHVLKSASNPGGRPSEAEMDAMLGSADMQLIFEETGTVK